eukprot:14377883-Alexandrium_andersonii.AAC.1
MSAGWQHSEVNAPTAWAHNAKRATRIDVAVANHLAIGRVAGFENLGHGHFDVHCPLRVTMDVERPPI